MGLDTTHGCWRGSYSAFHRWRNKLAEVAGYTFSPAGEPFEMSGIQVMSTSMLMPNIDWGNIERTIGVYLDGKWPQMPVRPDGTPDPLIVLIAHSDCDGVIQAEFCGPLADRLEGLLDALGDEDGGGHIGSYREKTETFITGLRKAAKRGQKVTFY